MFHYRFTNNYVLNAHREATKLKKASKQPCQTWQKFTSSGSTIQLQISQILITDYICHQFVQQYTENTLYLTHAINK